MSSRRRVHRVLSAGEQDAALRLAVAYAGMEFFQYLVTSQSLVPVFGTPAFTVDEWPLLPHVMRGLLLIAFFMIVRREFRDTQPAWPDRRQICLAAIMFSAAAASVAIAMHPSTDRVFAVLAFLQEFPYERGMVVGALIWLAFTVPLVPLILLLFPAAFLYRHRWLLVAGWCLYAAYLCGEVANAYYFRVTGPFLTSAVQWTVGLFPGGTTARLSRWTVAYERFAIEIGPACSEFAALALLGGVLAVTWWRRPPRTPARIALAFVMLVLSAAGLFVLNVIRIALIMALGAKWPELAIGLFHGGVGGILMIAYIAAILPIAAQIGGRGPNRTATV